MKISVVINTYNAERDLKKVLESVKGFDEILICDMYSTDKTISIAEEYNCRIVYHENTGFVEPARDYAIHLATYPWVLVVDADEIVPQALKKYLYDIIRRPDCPSGLKIPLKNYFMGKFMRSTYPNYVLRFFKKEVTSWPPHIHSQPIIKGVVETIPASKKELAFIHISNDSISVMLYKANNYTEREIKRREDKKYSLFSLIFGPFFRFIKSYILKGAILDGKVGFIYSCFNSYYKYLTISKVIEKQADYKDLEQDINKELGK